VTSHVTARETVTMPIPMVPKLLATTGANTASTTRAPIKNPTRRARRMCEQSKVE